jgi:hypothetical protein
MVQTREKEASALQVCVGQRHAAQVGPTQICGLQVAVPKVDGWNKISSARGNFLVLLLKGFLVDDCLVSEHQPVAKQAEDHAVCGRAIVRIDFRGRRRFALHPVLPFLKEDGLGSPAHRPCLKDSHSTAGARATVSRMQKAITVAQRGLGPRAPSTSGAFLAPRGKKHR